MTDVQLAYYRPCLLSFLRYLVGRQYTLTRDIANHYGTSSLYQVRLVLKYLLEHGYVRMYNPGYNYHLYRITPAGIRLLEDEKA